jgi:hypothetical protein
MYVFMQSVCYSFPISDKIRVSRYFPVSNLLKIRSADREYLHLDGETDIAKLISPLLQTVVTKAPHKNKFCSILSMDTNTASEEDPCLSI